MALLTILSAAVSSSAKVEIRSSLSIEEVKFTKARLQTTAVPFATKTLQMPAHAADTIAPERRTSTIEYIFCSAEPLTCCAMKPAASIAPSA